mmetsp:Transcript_9403/g.26557  ORF Transcript_9403/g.26557 Transcript_9403/m.26557 type:complete len:219 (-) Transcript_9403:288-944(-)
MDVYREADGPALVRNGPQDCLLDPPRGVRGELEPLLGVELLHGPHEAKRALLDEVCQSEPTLLVALGDGDHEAQVGGDHGLLGALPTQQLAPQLVGLHAHRASPLLQSRRPTQLVLQPVSHVLPANHGLHLARQQHLLFCSQQGMLADGLEKPPQLIARGASGTGSRRRGGHAFALLVLQRDGPSSGPGLRGHGQGGRDAAVRRGSEGREDAWAPQRL